VKGLLLKGAGRSLEKPHWHGGQNEEGKACNSTDAIRFIHTDGREELSEPTTTGPTSHSAVAAVKLYIEDVIEPHTAAMLEP
jgi:hypothetical protein